MSHKQAITVAVLSSFGGAFAYCSSRFAVQTHQFARVPVPRTFSFKRNFQLSSTIVDGSSAATNAPVEFPIPEGSAVAARGSVISFTGAVNSRNGIMVLQLREHDDIRTTNELNGYSNVEARALSAPTAMFKQSAVASKKKTNSQGDDFTGKEVVFSDGKRGIIVAQRPPLAFVLCEFCQQVDIDTECAVLDTRGTIQASDSLVGKIVDCFGHVVQVDNDGSVINSSNDDMMGRTEPFMRRDIFAPIPQVKDISLINSPFLTGTAMIDALVPIGRGQNMLIVGEHNLGQRQIFTAAIRTQIEEMKRSVARGITCVYAITTMDNKERVAVIKSLQDAGLLEHILVVVSRDNQDSKVAYAEAIAVAAAACALGEAFALAKKQNCGVFIDNIDQHKNFWDWTTKSLVDVYGVEAVVKADLDGGASSEMRAFFSGLIQRAARFNKSHGDGSVTLLLLANIPSLVGDDDEETRVFTLQDFLECNEKVKERVAILEKKGVPLTISNLRKIKLPLPISSQSDADRKRRLALQHIDDLISMTDGQIWLEEKNGANGQWPMMDPQRSITRVGIGADTDSRADAPIIRKLVGGLRFDFAQALSLDGAEAGSNLEKQLLKRDVYLLALSQDPGQVRKLSQVCALLIAASSGRLDSIVHQKKCSSLFISDLLQHVEAQVPALISEIDINNDVCDSALEELRQVIRNYIVT